MKDKIWLFLREICYDILYTTYFKFAKKGILTILEVGFIYPNLMKNIIKI
jgi:hypothetical protein